MDTRKIIEDIQKVNDFKNRLRKRDYPTSTIIAIETAKLFKDVIKETVKSNKVNNFQELNILLRELGKIFISCDQMQFSIGNIIKRILHIVHEEMDKNMTFQDSLKDSEINKQNVLRVTSLNRLLDHNNIKPDTNKQIISMNSNNQSNQIEESLENILNNINDLISELEYISEEINSKASEYINEGDVILTASSSDQLAEFLMEAAQHKKFSVIIAESAPSMVGHEQAKKLQKHNIHTTVINDAAVYAVMSNVNKVIIGTRAVMANGGLISYNGTYNLCICAHIFKVPVIVVGGTFKLTAMYPFGHETRNEFRSPDVVFGNDFEYKDDISNITFNTPAYDYVPPELLTMYITNNGSMNPEFIYRMFSEIYSQADYFL